MKAYRYILWGLMLALLAATPFAARAAECVDRLEQIIEPLADKYGESQMWRGMSERDGVTMEIVVFANPDGTTWTIVGHVEPNPWCVLSSGNRWDMPAAPAKGEEG
jgi:hypothetical protein